MVMRESASQSLLSVIYRGIGVVELTPKIA